MKTYSVRKSPISALNFAIRGAGWQRYTVFALSLLAAIVHVVLIPHRWEEWWLSGGFFLLAGTAQALGGAALLRQPRTSIMVLGISGNLGLILLYSVVQTIGLPGVPSHSHQGEAALLDIATIFAEIGVVAILLDMLLHPASPSTDGPASASMSWRLMVFQKVLRFPRFVAVSFVAGVALLSLGFILLGNQRSAAATASPGLSSAICMDEKCATQLTATLITEKQAERMGLRADVVTRSRTSQPFLVSVNTHEGNIESLSLDGKLFLRADGQLYPAVGRTLQLSAHHDNYLVFFPKYGMNGHALFGEDAATSPTHQMEDGAVMSGHHHSAPTPEISAAVSSYEIVVKDLQGNVVAGALQAGAAQNAAPSTAAILGLVGGFLASMWPCLFQLTAYFIPSLAGISMQEARSATSAETRKRVIRTALYFVAGITIVYTTAGAVAGYASQSLQGAPLFEELRRPLAIVAGIVILVMAARVAAKARVPLVCHMPLVSFGKQGTTGPLATMITGVAFATGCMSCFGAAIALGMLSYIASSGSVLSGALILFAFSLGISIPLVLAATAMAQALPFLGKLERWAPVMGIASSIVMAGFALILLTDNYHAVSDLISRTIG